MNPAGVARQGAGEGSPSATTVPDVLPGRIDGGPALAALRRGPFTNLTASYHYLLFMTPRQWGLRTRTDTLHLVGVDNHGSSALHPDTLKPVRMQIGLPHG